MKAKKVLKFYFSAEGLERYIGGLILKLACDFCGDGDKAAERICSLIEEKRALSRLWSYLDGVIEKFSERERDTLKFYANLRRCANSLPEEIYRETKRVVTKFTRRARRLESFNRERELVNKYYCVLGGNVIYPV